MSRTAAVLVAVLAVVAGLLSEHVRQVWIQPLWVPLIDLAVGWMLVGCGLVAAVARPNQPAGRRLVLAGFLWIVAAPRQWFGGTGRTDDFLQLDALSFTLVGWSDVMLAFTALAFAGRWPERRRERVVVWALVAVFAAQTAVRVVFRWPDLAGADLLDHDTIAPWVAFADLGRITVLAVAGVLLCLRWLRASRASRFLLGPVLLAGAASCFAPLSAAWYPLSQLGLFAPVVEDVAVPEFWLANAVRMLVPIAMLLGILRQRGSRAGVADALAQVGGQPTVLQLERALARALGDPSLRVLVREGGGGYLDSAGAPSPLPAPDRTAAVAIVPGGDGPLAALVHDPALDEDPTIVAAGVAMAGLVLDNDRLGRELMRQLDEVRASRTRIVEAGDAERRRIERDLHDGVQQRLLALALALRRAASAVTDPAASESLRRGADEAIGVVDDVRRLAQGIHPALLSEAGLPAALRALASRSPVPVDVEVSIEGPVPPSTAAAVYFVASEALANVVKHSGATGVRLAASEERGAIRLVVEDDGRGGADPLGNGFRGLDDRVSAVGGTLVVAERAGGGTAVTALVPAG